MGRVGTSQVVADACDLGEWDPAGCGHTGHAGRGTALGDIGLKGTQAVLDWAGAVAEAGVGAEVGLRVGGQRCSGGQCGPLAGSGNSGHQRAGAEVVGLEEGAAGLQPPGPGRPPAGGLGPVQEGGQALAYPGLDPGARHQLPHRQWQGLAWPLPRVVPPGPPSSCLRLALPDQPIP